MTIRRSIDDYGIKNRVQTLFDSPPASAIHHSRARLRAWFAQTAPMIEWDQMVSPLGELFVGVTQRGLCVVDFGHSKGEFLERFDAHARLARNPRAVAQVTAQLREYFSGARKHFTLAVDLSSLTPFQRRVLDAARLITPGTVWTYHHLAQAIGRPQSSRPVGQALGRNPIPIVIPCHRVIASDGSLGGYSGGSGLKAKRWLLELEGALS